MSVECLFSRTPLPHPAVQPVPISRQDLVVPVVHNILQLDIRVGDDSVHVHIEQKVVRGEVLAHGLEGGSLRTSA